ncbi:DUF5691 domain-containing protein [Nocardioides sp. GY 10127]|uniref:DUF5691 domain-containing protein n=1 Tax=Nocardioides sp. GY 10127 TaxID=2569762 RepID=UPI0010A8B81F|nr:DUF5691 domain-containing protein [Nocardioides sp. GY 10127]TIC79329.1 hypothetical protein E8D37_17170 [Nocardioides sp. GY 10127]
MSAPATPAGVRAWWEAVEASALVGTARRPLPPDLASPLPVRPDADPATALLDAAAAGSVLRRAAAVPPEAEAWPEPSPPDVLDPAPARAGQLLTLLLTQSPVGALTPHALRRWLEAAATRGVRAPHPTLVGLLTTGTQQPSLRPAVLPVLDARGAWLAGGRKEWAWARGGSPVDPAHPDEAAWRLLPSAQRAVALRRLRAADPAAGLALLTSTWRQDRAEVRAELLTALEAGLSEADGAFLESALDDRSAAVRERALALLDALPGSPRARRLGDVLDSLVVPQGRLRRGVEVALPDDSAAAPRDGLGPAPRGRSRRGWWLERITAGAPLEVWTADGVTPEVVVRSLAAAGSDALPGLLRAVALRGDVEWARAVLRCTWDARIAAVLPEAERGPLVLARVGAVTSVPDLTSAVRLLPGPWDEATSLVVLARLERLQRPPHVLTDLVDVLADRLHPAVATTLRRLAPAEGPAHPLHRLATLLDLVPALTEAFR